MRMLLLKWFGMKKDFIGKLRRFVILEFCKIRLWEKLNTSYFLFQEIRILEHLRKQDKDNTMNIIHMLDHFNFRNHTCITFELLSINLYELIKKNKFQVSKSNVI